jgi:plasmid stabilization system protein ParE
MVYKVVLTPRAARDADEATAYIKAFAPEAAARWFGGLKAAVLSLSEFPERCALAPEAELFGVELRQLLYGRRSGVYRILFRVEAEPEPLVRIIAVRHGARLPLEVGDLGQDS